MRRVHLVLGFPGVGKTTLFNNRELREQLDLRDSDSSKFPKDDFPKNYIDHLENVIVQKSLQKLPEESVYKPTVILCSTHKDVREELTRRGMDYTLVYPNPLRKEEYLERYRQRGSSESFIELISNNWDDWIADLKKDKHPGYELLEGGFLSGVITTIIIN